MQSAAACGNTPKKLAPGDEQPLTAAKSELKYFEAGLLGVPTVASNVPAYRTAIADGEKARQDVLRRQTTQARAPEFKSALADILSRSSASRAAHA
jgi:hypothetical protein